MHELGNLLTPQPFASNCPFSPAFARGCNRCLRLRTCWHLTLISENASIIMPTCPSGNCATKAASVTPYHGHGGTANSRALIFLIAHKLAHQTVSVLFCQPKGLSISSSATNLLYANFILANPPPTSLVASVVEGLDNLQHLRDLPSLRFSPHVRETVHKGTMMCPG